MAVLNFCGFETGDSGESQSITGTASVQSTVALSGTYALRVNPTTTAVGNYRFAKQAVDGGTSQSFQVSTLYSRFYFRIATAPASGDEEFYAVLDVAGTPKCTLRLNSSRQIALYNSTTVLVSTGATALSLNTWYRIETQTTSSASASAYEVKIDGISELSGTTTQATGLHGSVRVGKTTNRNGQTVDFYYDDCLWNDSTYPGPGSVARLFPTSNGTTFQWSLGTATSYTEVAETVTDGDTTYVASGTAGDVFLVNCQAMPSASSVSAVKGWAVTRYTAIGTSSFMRIVSGATASNNSSGSPGTTYVNRVRLLENDPNTGVAWTEANVNLAQVGYVIAPAPTTVGRVTTVSLMVDFVPDTGNRSTLPTSAVAVATLAPSATTTEKNFITLPTSAVSVDTYAPTITVTTAGGNSVTLPTSAVSTATFPPSATTTEKNFSQITTSQVAVQTYAPTVTTTTLTFNNVSNLPTSAISVATYPVQVVVSGGILPTGSLGVGFYPDRKHQLKIPQVKRKSKRDIQDEAKGVSLKQFFKEIKDPRLEETWDLTILEKIEDDKPMEFLREFFGEKKLPYLIDRYGLKFMLKIRRVLLALLQDEEDGDYDD